MENIDAKSVGMIAVAIAGLVLLVIGIILGVSLTNPDTFDTGIIGIPLAIFGIVLLIGLGIYAIRSREE